MASRPKNVLFLWTDQQRPDTIGAYGNRHIRTPHLDRLAAASSLFESAYCAQPVCSPARASVLTGLYAHTHGVIQNSIGLNPDTPTIAELLQPAGYVCGYIGKWHLGDELAPQRGFEPFWVSTEGGYAASHGRDGYDSYHHFLVSQGYTPADPHRDGVTFNRFTAAGMPEAVGKPAFMAAETNRFLDTHRDQPFFLSVNFLEPHAPFNGPFDGMYQAEDMTLPDSWSKEMDETVPRRYHQVREGYAGEYMAAHPHWVKSNDEWGWKELKARYWGLCTLVDKYAGQILQHLEELGLADDTIVVYTSDHGHMMGEHRLLNKSVQYEGAVQIPLMVKVPGLAPRRMATPVSHVSLMPTLLELLDQPLPKHLQGESLVPLLAEGDTAPDQGEVFIEWNGPFQESVSAGRGAVLEVRTIRRGRWKLSVHLSGEHELYDLQADPGEEHNAFHDPGREEIIALLYQRLRHWQQETNDALAPPELPSG